MENQNIKGLVASLIVIITLLFILCLLFATGAISFKSNKVDINETDQNIIDNESDQNIIDKLVGTYEYKGEYVDNDENIGNEFTVEQTTYDKLKLNSSGYAEASAGNVRAGGYSAKGKWYVSNNELIIVNEQCKAVVINNEVVYPNCHPTWTYNYKFENEKLILTSNNNSMTTVNLNKVN